MVTVRSGGRGTQLAVLCWHLLARMPTIIGRVRTGCQQRRAIQPQARQPAEGDKRDAPYAYNVKELHDREIDVARHAGYAYEQFVSRWQPRRLKTAHGCRR